MLEISPTNQIIGNTYSAIIPDIYDQFKSDNDAEVFEKLVLDLMLNKYSDDKELTDYILSLPRDKKRMAVLSVIDGDNILWSKMNSFVNGCSDKFEHIKDVIKIINQFVKDGEIEKRNFGEVMTPITLVREMLDILPKDVWSNPNLKWLDPCNGAGTFPFVVVYKLMVGLKDWQPDVELRYKHIVENMIYTCELQSRNVFLWLCGIDPKDEYTTNTYWGSFLDDAFDYHMKNVWGVKNFDIVIGNPPYQSSSEDIRGSKSIYNIFVEKSYMISENTLMVTPSRWFLNKNMESFRKSMLCDYGLKILNECDDDVFPNAEIKGGVSYFLLSKSYTGDVLFNGELNKFESGIISSMDVNRLIKYIDGQKKFLSDIFNSGSYFKIETNDNRLSDTNNGGLRCYMSKMNGLIKYINPELVPNKPNKSKYKLIIPSASGSKGNIGVLGRFEISNPDEVCSSSFVHFAFDNIEHCENLKSYLECDFIKLLIRIKKPTQRVKKDVFSLIPIVPLNIKWTNELVNEYFKISKDDCDFIKSNI